MQELERILLEHAERYPLMEAQDAVKLIYQNEFGAAHMISDESACRTALRAEYETTAKDPSLPLLEPIGNGTVRVQLAALAAEDIDALAAAFIAGAGSNRGTLSSFRAKLVLLAALAEAGRLPFSPAALDAFLAGYARAGYPSLSHSESYRRAYRPAYRIIPAPQD